MKDKKTKQLKDKQEKDDKKDKQTKRHFMARRDGERMRLELSEKKGQISEEMRTPRDVYVEHSCDGLYLFIAR